jgi:transcriptional antiterminator RfaH
MKCWYVVHTRPQGEMMACQNLKNQGYEIFLPRYSKPRRHARKMDVVLAPLFPRYLFVAFDVTVDPWFAINSTRGVAYLVRQQDIPIAVPEGIIESLKKSADLEEVVPLSTLALFRQGEQLEIREGAFVGHTGYYEKMTDDGRVQLLLTLLGRSVKVAVPIHAVDAVA